MNDFEYYIFYKFVYKIIVEFFKDKFEIYIWKNFFYFWYSNNKF